MCLSIFTNKRELEAPVKLPRLGLESRGFNLGTSQNDVGREIGWIMLSPAVQNCCFSGDGPWSIVNGCECTVCTAVKHHCCAFSASFGPREDKIKQRKEQIRYWILVSDTFTTMFIDRAPDNMRAWGKTLLRSRESLTKLQYYVAFWEMSFLEFDT